MSSRRTSLLTIIAVGCISYLLDPTPDRLPFLALAAAILGTILLPRTKKERIAGILLCCALLFFFIGPVLSSQFIEETLAGITAEPMQHWPAPAAQVGLGGQQITFRGDGRYYIATVCYWLNKHQALVAAHRIKEFSVGASMPIQLVAEGLVEELSAEILFNDDNGVGIKLADEPSSPWEQLPIAGTSEIIIGGEAEIISIHGGSFPVIVKGFLAMDSQQEKVVIERINDTDNFIGGMSGSPIVQNGKIIGFMSSTLRGMKGLAFGNVAGQAYAQTEGLMQEYAREKPQK